MNELSNNQSIVHTEDADTNSQNVHRIDNTAYLQEGMYCRSFHAIDKLCVESDVLLITDLRLLITNCIQ